MSKIRVIGTGGIGLCLLPTLCRYVNYSEKLFPEPQIHLIDGDSFEEKNRARQAFTEYGNKASQTKAALEEQFGRIQFTDHPVFLDDTNVVRHVRDGDIVLLCVDNHKTRKLVSDRACELDNVTVISGGNDTEDGNVLIHIRRDGKDLTPPLASRYHPEIANPTDLHPGELANPGSCDRIAADVPQVVIVNNLIAANMLAAFYSITKPEIYTTRVLARPEMYGETLTDVRTLTTVARERFAHPNWAVPTLAGVRV